MGESSTSSGLTLMLGIHSSHLFLERMRTKTPKTAWSGVCYKILEKNNQAPVGINERLMTYRLQFGKDKPMNLMSSYAPTMQATDEAKEQFYEQLNQQASQIPTNKSLTILGDFNARVGKDREAWSGVIGQHGSGKMNSNGELLLSFSAQDDLVITNTMFQLKNISSYWHAIDHIIV